MICYFLDIKYGFIFNEDGTEVATFDNMFEDDIIVCGGDGTLNHFINNTRKKPDLLSINF